MQAFTTLYQHTFENSVSIPGPDWQRDRGQAAADANAHVVIGVNEREPHAGTIYNTLAYIGPDGSLARQAPQARTDPLRVPDLGLRRRLRSRRL